MRNSLRKSRQFGFFSSAWIGATLALFLSALMPVTAFAQMSCNSRLLYFTEGPSGGQWFPGDEITVTALLGAQDIDGGSYLDIPDFGFAMDCQEVPGLVYDTCVANGHQVEFLGEITPGASCVNSAGDPIVFPQPQSSFIDFIPLNGPLRVPENGGCVISWKFRVNGLNALGDSTERIWQVLSFPLDRKGDPAMCDNGLTTAGDRAGFVDIDTCSIDVEKQICSPDETDCTLEQNWFDADSQEAALLLSLDGLAAYRAIITNNGSADYLGDITVDDDTLDIHTTISGLAAGASVTLGGSQAQASWSNACTSTTDIVNTIEVGAQCRAGEAPVFTEATDSAWGDCERFRVRMPALTLDKTASPSTYSAVGEQISYSYELTSSGNVSLYPPYTVDDDKATVSCPPTPAELTVGSTVTCTATYTITQADLNAGSVTNTATATAQDEFGNDVVSNQDQETVTANQNPALSLVKTGSGPDNDYDAPGDVLSYSYLVTNSGNVSLAGPVTVADDKSSDESCPNVNTVGNNDGFLDPGESVTCTASYTVTQGDVNAGSVTNTAQASADGVDSNEDDETLNAEQNPALTLVKTGSGPDNDYDAPGDVLNYSYLVTNSGNVSLAGPVTVADDKSSDESCPDVATVGNNDANLDPGESITCTASYTVTQADVNAGSVTNTAQASADGVDSNEDDETLNAEQNPALTLVKTATPTTYDAVGDVIGYSYLVTNTGNVSLAGPVTVADDKSSDESCPNVNTVGNADGFLDPGESITCTASYTITQADLNAGSVTNVAQASADGVDSNTDDETVTAQQSPALSLVKTGSGPDNDYDAPGDVLNYSYLVTNSGNISLAGPVTVADDKSSDESCPNVNTVGNADGFLDPGESITCTASYTVTQGDVNAGSVTNTAQASADGVDSNEDDETLNAEQGPALTLVKTGSGPDNDYDAPGDVLSYSYLVTNSGNVSLAGPVTVADDKSSDESCPNVNTVGNADGFLDPGESITCTASYTVTQGDVNAGSVTNTAQASADGVDSNEDDETLNAEQNPALTLVKTATPKTYEAVDDVIGYSYLVTNSGNVSLAGPVTVADDKSSDESCPDVSTVGDNDANLDPGESITCTASYTIVADDITAGSVTNTAQASADGTQSNTDDETVYLIGIQIRKDIWDGSQYVAADDPASAPVEYWPSGALYRLVVKNTGNSALENVKVNDTTLGIVDFVPDGLGDPGDLAIGEEIEIYAAELPALDQTEAVVCDQSGDFDNTATVSGDSAINGAVQDSDVAWLSCVGTPDLTVDKQICLDDGQDSCAGEANWFDSEGPVQAPSGAVYRIIVENTGTAKLVDVTVSDTLIGLPDHVIGELDVGAIAVVADGTVHVGDSTWPALDVDTVCEDPGPIDNIASVTGTSDEDPTDSRTRTDMATLVCIGTPTIEILKDVCFDDGADSCLVPGNWLPADVSPFPTATVDPLNPVTALYRFTVTNTGPVQLTGVSIDDTNLVITDYVPIGTVGAGVLEPAETVVVGPSDLAELTVQNRCDSPGEKANVAMVEGFSAAGTKAEDTNPATVECVGQPAIQILKEVSADGINFDPASVATFAPDDGWYRITVENIGTVDLVNVEVNDTILGLSNIVVTGAGGAGSLAVGESVTLSHTGGGPNEVPELYIPGLCAADGVIENTAIASGDAVGSLQNVQASDVATYYCSALQDVCDDGKPSKLTVLYDADSDTSNSQNPSEVTISPPDAVFPPGNVWITVHDHKDKFLAYSAYVAPNQSFTVSGPRKLISSSYFFRIYASEGDPTPIQTIRFHTSCSEPLAPGDEFGGITVIGGGF